MSILFFYIASLTNPRQSLYKIFRNIFDYQTKNVDKSISLFVLTKKIERFPKKQFPKSDFFYNTGLDDNQTSGDSHVIGQKPCTIQIF
jgi:hypothetical protein